MPSEVLTAKFPGFAHSTPDALGRDRDHVVAFILRGVEAATSQVEVCEWYRLGRVILEEMDVVGSELRWGGTQQTQRLQDQN